MREVRDAKTEEKRKEHESEVKAQGGQEDDAYSMHESRTPSMRFKGEHCENETTSVPKGHMVEKRLVDPCGQRTTPGTARGRRRTWRAARRAAEQARDDDRVEETQISAEHAEVEKMGQEEMGARKNQKGRKHHPARCLPFPNRKRNNSSNSSSSNRRDASAVTHMDTAVMVDIEPCTTFATGMWMSST